MIYIFNGGTIETDSMEVAKRFRWKMGRRED
jgi:hypothetical protein